MAQAVKERLTISTEAPAKGGAPSVETAFMGFSDFGQQKTPIESGFSADASFLCPHYGGDGGSYFTVICNTLCYYQTLLKRLFYAV